MVLFSSNLPSGSEVDLVVRVFQGISSLFRYRNSKIRNHFASAIIAFVILEMPIFEPLPVRFTSRQADQRAIAPRRVSSRRGTNGKLNPIARVLSRVEPAKQANEGSPRSSRAAAHSPLAKKLFPSKRTLRKLATERDAPRAFLVAFSSLISLYEPGQFVTEDRKYAHIEPIDRRLQRKQGQDKEIYRKQGKRDFGSSRVNVKGVLLVGLSSRNTSVEH